MKFVSYNIQYGFGSDAQCDLQRTVEAIAEADVVAGQIAGPLPRGQPRHVADPHGVVLIGGVVDNRCSLWKLVGRV